MKQIGNGHLSQLMSHKYNKKNQILNSYKPAPPKPVGIIPDDADVVFDTHANSSQAEFISLTHDWTVSKNWYHNKY
ncbi:MAG: hypothetical protein AAGF06_01435 [Pseudomonadota bacterium]